MKLPTLLPGLFSSFYKETWIIRLCNEIPVLMMKYIEICEFKGEVSEITACPFCFFF